MNLRRGAHGIRRQILPHFVQVYKEMFFFIAEVYKEIIVPNLLVGDKKFPYCQSTRKSTMKFGIAQPLYFLLPFF
jgi:hypothetical protein